MTVCAGELVRFPAANETWTGLQWGTPKDVWCLVRLIPNYPHASSLQTTKLWLVRPGFWCQDYSNEMSLEIAHADTADGAFALPIHGHIGIRPLAC